MEILRLCHGEEWDEEVGNKHLTKACKWTGRLRSHRPRLIKECKPNVIRRNGDKSTSDPGDLLNVIQSKFAFLFVCFFNIPSPQLF